VTAAPYDAVLNRLRAEFLEVPGLRLKTSSTPAALSCSSTTRTTFRRRTQQGRRVQPEEHSLKHVAFDSGRDLLQRHGHLQRSKLYQT
jgi:hypothetical protein